MRIEISAKGVEQLSHNFKRIGESLPEYSERVLGWVGGQVVGIMRGVLETEEWRGTLKDSVKIKEIGPDRVVIGPDADHALAVLRGQERGTVPDLELIRAWTADKLQETEKIADKIWWSIQRYGTSAHYIEVYRSEGFPFTRLTMKSGEMQAVLQTAADALAGTIAAEIATPGGRVTGTSVDDSFFDEKEEIPS